VTSRFDSEQHALMLRQFDWLQGSKNSLLKDSFKLDVHGQIPPKHHLYQNSLAKSPLMFSVDCQTRSRREPPVAFWPQKM